jgi:diguanylate cyclase (GGDEF)-like protein
LFAAVVLVRRREPAPLPAHIAFSLVFGVFGAALFLAATAAVAIPLFSGHNSYPSAAALGEIPLALDQIVGCLVFVALLAMTGERALARLESEALHDPQTGLLNRRGLETSLSRMLALAHRSNSPVSLLLADLDDFKSINDRYGHHMGDVALQLVVSTARRVLKRQSDFAARFGGDEFAILLLDTDLAGARVVAEKLRKAVAEQPIVVGETSIEITLSIGIALVPPSEPDLGAALSRADKGLYLAKSRGRNQVAEADPQPVTVTVG